MINKFTGRFDFLSNFYLHKVDFEGVTYPSSEHAYQAAKTLDKSLRLGIANLPTPGKAKKAGKNLELREDWEDVKVDIMREILVTKFQDPELQTKLLDTGYHELIEGNTWGDRFWGVCEGTGQNHLGKLLMSIRQNIMQVVGTPKYEQGAMVTWGEVKCQIEEVHWESGHWKYWIRPTAQGFLDIIITESNELKYTR